jgi:quercetin dioxygenase-like cupin family protein
MSTTTRKSLALASAVTTLALAGATAALATAPSGETPTPLARGQLLAPANVNRGVDGGRVRIKTQGALDALMLNITLAPGGTGGWHSHAGPLITVVTQGTLTIIDAQCKRHDIHAGQAFISPGSTTKDENLDPTSQVVFDVTFLIPHSAASPRIDQPAPAGCSA